LLDSLLQEFFQIDECITYDIFLYKKVIDIKTRHI